MVERKPKVYVTGKVAGHTKDAVRAIVEEHGCQWSSTVSKNLTLLITGEKPGPTKLAKAKALGIRILSWEEFVAHSSRRLSIRNGLSLAAASSASAN